MEINLSAYFATLAVCASTVLLITGWLTTHVFKTINGTGKQILSWVVSIGAGFAAQWFGWGLFVGEGLVATLLDGLAVGLIANGLFNLEFIQAILEALKAKIKK
jgi:hypothetical protein